MFVLLGDETSNRSQHTMEPSNTKSYRGSGNNNNTITLGLSSLHSCNINKNTSTIPIVDPANDSLPEDTTTNTTTTTTTSGLTVFHKMQGVDDDGDNNMSISPAAVHFHPAMPRPTRESVLQRLSEALLRRSLAKVCVCERKRVRESDGFCGVFLFSILL